MIATKVKPIFLSSHTHTNMLRLLVNTEHAAYMIGLKK